MSDACDSGTLRRRPAARAASPATQWRAAFALAAIAAVGACATAPKTGLGGSIDFRDADGHEGTLAALRGNVIVIDLCASWAAACNVNAKVLDEAQLAFAGQRVELVTILVDEGDVGREALRAYRDVLGVKHAVVLAGARVRAGTSALGDAGYVPRLVILDGDGAVVVDDSGGVINLQGLVARVNAAKRGAAP